MKSTFGTVAVDRRDGLGPAGDSVRHRPGTDIALINGLMYIILEKGWEDQKFIAERTEGYETLSESVQEYTPEAVEKIARRLMQAAHRIEEPGCEFIERFIEEQLAHSGNDGDGGFIPPSFGKEFSERALPLIPEVHELARGIVQDVRPMLPIQKQLQMAGEMMAFKTFMNGFEDTMKKWASGEVTEYEDPFRQQQTKKRNENGETPSLEGARRQAQAARDLHARLPRPDTSSRQACEVGAIGQP